MLVDGDWVTGVTGDSGAVSGSRVVPSLSEGAGGDQYSRSLLGSPRDVTTGVAAGSFWPALIDFGAPVVNTGGGGRPFQPHSRNATTSWKLHLSPITTFREVARTCTRFPPHAAYSSSVKPGGRPRLPWSLRSSKQRSTTDGSTYASNVAPATLNRMVSACVWRQCSFG